MKRVKGFFVLIIKQFDDTMFGANYHYTTWCIGWQKYCRFSHVEKLRLFDTYESALQYKKLDEKANSHKRCLEIAYLTTAQYSAKEPEPKQLTKWVQINSEEDAVFFDQQQLKGQTKTKNIATRAPTWDSNEFSSIFS